MCLIFLNIGSFGSRDLRFFPTVRPWWGYNWSYDRYDLEIFTPSNNKMDECIAWISKVSLPPTHKHNHSQLLAWNVMIKDHGGSLRAIKLLDIALYLFFFNWLTFVHIFSWILHCFNVWFIVLNNNIHIVSMTKWCQMWDLLIVINRNKVLQLYILINLNCLAVHYSY